MRLWRRSVNPLRYTRRLVLRRNYRWLQNASIRLHSDSSLNDGDDDMDLSTSKALPEASGINADSSTQAAESVTMLRFDSLGPAVVTETGKVRFFEDWEGKTDQEKEDILKIIIPRNKQRLQQIQDQQIESTVNAAVDDLKQRELKAHKELLRAQAETEEAESKIDWSKNDPRDR